jgi:spore germination cell wall hydrolase CwlJ-like protein
LANISLKEPAMSDPYAQTAADPDLQQVAAAGGGSAQPAPGAEPPDPDDVNALARMIFAEGDSLYRVPGAMEGIGWVARNRMSAPGFPDTLQGVLTQPGRNGAPQFQAVGNAISRGSKQWQLSADPSQLQGPDVAAYQRAHDVAQGILGGQIPDPTGGATFYRTSPWAAHPPEDGYKAPGVPPKFVRTVPSIGDTKQGWVTFYNAAASP